MGNALNDEKTNIIEYELNHVMKEAVVSVINLINERYEDNPTEIVYTPNRLLTTLSYLSNLISRIQDHDGVNPSVLSSLSKVLTIMVKDGVCKKSQARAVAKNVVDVYKSHSLSIADESDLNAIANYRNSLRAKIHFNSLIKDIGSSNIRESSSTLTLSVLKMIDTKEWLRVSGEWETLRSILWFLQVPEILWSTNIGDDNTGIRNIRPAQKRLSGFVDSGKISPVDALITPIWTMTTPAQAHNFFPIAELLNANDDNFVAIAKVLAEASRCDIFGVVDIDDMLAMIAADAPISVIINAAITRVSADQRDDLVSEYPPLRTPMDSTSFHNLDLVPWKSMVPNT